MRYLIIIFLLTFCLNNHLFSQPQGPLSPASSGTDGSVGTFDWTNSGNVFSSDNSRARVDLDNNGDISYYLTATNFGFSIPSTSSIDGIVVEIERSDNGGSGNIKDNVVKIIKGGTITGTDNASGANWPSADEYKTYGNATNLWGTTWTVADINASNFGVAISAKRTGGGGNNRARIDHIHITVYYTSTLPIELLYFNGTSKNNSVELYWVTASEINNDYFIVYKSSDGLTFNEFITIKGGGNSNSPLTYTSVDIEPYDVTYYKLSQVDYNGASKSFNIISVNHIKTNNIKIAKITNILGQEVKDDCDCVKIYYFDDGSVIKKYTMR